jgi:hypothetical protein
VLAADAEVERLILQTLTSDRIAVAVAALAKSDAVRHPLWPADPPSGLRQAVAVPAAGGVAGGSRVG